MQLYFIYYIQCRFLVIAFVEGRDLCWFSSKKALLVYFAVPFAGIMSANAALFVASSLVIFDSTKNKVGASCGGGQTKTNFWLYLKLAVVMGIGWSLGLAAGFANHVTGLWYAFIACNTLQVTKWILTLECLLKDNAYSFGLILY